MKSMKTNLPFPAVPWLFGDEFTAVFPSRLWEFSIYYLEQKVVGKVPKLIPWSSMEQRASLCLWRRDALIPLAP
jgi:hypothetical protein